MNITPATHFIVYTDRDNGISGHPVAGFLTEAEATTYTEDREVQASAFGITYRVEAPVGKTTMDEANAIEAAAYSTEF